MERWHIPPRTVHVFCQFVTDPCMTVHGAAPALNFIIPYRQGGKERH